MSLEGKRIEDKTVDRLMSKLTENLEINDVMDKCLSEELITEEDLTRITATVNAGKKAEAIRDLMSHVKRSPPGYLTTFYRILEDSKSSYLAPDVAKGMLEKGAKWQVPGLGEALSKIS